MPPQEPGQRAPVRPDASMSLLTTVMSHTLDEGYALAAARRDAEGRAALPPTSRARLWLTGGLLLAALLVTLGAAHAHEAAPEVAQERAQLLDRVRSGTEALDGLRAQVGELREEVAELRRAAEADPGAREAHLIALLAGATPVEGPGLELTLEDAEGAESAASGPALDPRGGGPAGGRVGDRDLQRVVNGLWWAGAEAIAVNDRRLTALSAIRTAGEAVLVDNRPLVPPYRVLAVGGGEEFAAAFRASGAERYLETLREEEGIGFRTEAREDLSLPAAPDPALRTARPVPDGGGEGPSGAAQTQTGAGPGAGEGAVR
ncbi:DUF881 domain-containing protein [Streptomyces hoynatensis]|uniref:DUF881 domain-containing protein n=2 Tax=Streptomyces hoynatensis TaxID=1141874 RepID=A0A3A9ZAK4_9ACTN|nr:DUF881 domain-containing protein [Streptomyces hoynatensis]RKN45069.1 DUF881 domain-containing protein [Streptomyces hoynatensis]